MIEITLLTVFGLGMDCVGAVLIASPLLHRSRWNTQYLDALKNQNEITLNSIKQGIGTISNTQVVEKILESENQFIERVKIEEGQKQKDKIQTYFGLGFLLFGFLLQVIANVVFMFKI